MFFRKKPCEACQLKDAKIRDLERLLQSSQEEVRSLKANSDRSQTITSARKGTKLKGLDVYDTNANNTPEASVAEIYATQPASGNNYFVKRSALRAKQEQEKIHYEEQRRLSVARSQENKPENHQKYKMTDAQRQRLAEKRRELKARIGPSGEEARILRRQKDREQQIEKIRQACEQHFPALARNLRLSQIYNDYGALISDGRAAECLNFLDSLKISMGELSQSEAIDIVLSTVTDLSDKQVSSQFSSEDHPDDGWEFENWVAEALQGFGWEARATQGSGDQGIDVVATKEGIRLGIQCKRYSGSVGNKAVQEAFSGAKHMGLEHAAVLTNAEFTKSAKELAASTGVLLLSPEDIPTLFEVLTQRQ